MERKWEERWEERREERREERIHMRNHSMEHSIPVAPNNYLHNKSNEAMNSTLHPTSQPASNHVDSAITFIHFGLVPRCFQSRIVGWGGQEGSRGWNIKWLAVYWPLLYPRAHSELVCLCTSIFLSLPVASNLLSPRSSLPSLLPSSPGVVSVVGNGIVLLVFCRKKKKLRPPELMTVNLAICDFGYSLLGAPCLIISRWAIPVAQSSIPHTDSMNIKLDRMIWYRCLLSKTIDS